MNVKEILHKLREKKLVVGAVLLYYLIRAISAIENYINPDDLRHADISTKYRLYQVYLSIGQFLIGCLLAYLFLRDNKFAKWIFLIYTGIVGLLLSFGCILFLIRDAVKGIHLEDTPSYIFGFLIGLLFINFSLALFIKTPPAPAPPG
jgi:hypothetical protein